MSDEKKPVGRPRVRPSESELAAMYSEHSAAYVAEHYGVSLWTARNWVEYYKRNPETGEMRNVRGKSGRPSQRPPESELAAMYNEYPASYIAKHYGVATFTVRRWIQYYRQNPTNPEGINVMPDKEQPQK